MPALTTVRISRSTLGTLAVDMIKKRMQHAHRPGVHLCIGGKLVVRDSTQEASLS